MFSGEPTGQRTSVGWKPSLPIAFDKPSAERIIPHQGSAKLKVESAR
jgi:hypothetical protein